MLFILLRGSTAWNMSICPSPYSYLLPIYSVSFLPYSPTKYYTFPISNWSLYVNSTNANVVAFVDPLFAFIDSAMKAGNSALIHCLAGAHRAGMYAASHADFFMVLQIPLNS